MALGITVEAVRGSSIHRGKYGRGKVEDGRVFVFLTPDQLMNGREHPAAGSAERLAPVRDLWPEKAELVEELRDHCAFLKGEHEARNEEIPRREEEHREEARRKDTIIAQRVPELPPAFSQEAPGGLERASEASGTVAKGRQRSSHSRARGCTGSSSGRGEHKKREGGRLSEQTPYGRVGEATKEFPLARPLGRVEEGPSYGHDDETSLGQGFVPGDLARIDVGFFRHEMNLKEVVAFFVHEEDAEQAIALRGEPRETEPPSGAIKFSGVSLRATVPADAAPGVYRFRRLEAETYKGQRVPFDSDTQERWGRWRFLVREEPDTPPTI